MKVILIVVVCVFSSLAFSAEKKNESYEALGKSPVLMRDGGGEDKKEWDKEEGGKKEDGGKERDGKESPPNIKEKPPIQPVAEKPPEELVCGDPGLVTGVTHNGKKYTSKPWYAPRQGGTVAVPRYVGHRKGVTFTATVKTKELAKQFKWVQYIRGYIWSAVYNGGLYKGVGNKGTIVKAPGKKLKLVTNTANTRPKVKNKKTKPPISEWTFDDLKKVGHYTTRHVGDKIVMVDAPGIDKLKIRPDAKTFLDANFEFRAYAVCPLAKKLAYARCVWNTRLTVKSYTFVRTADTPVCQVFPKPINLLKGGDPALKLPAKVQRTQDFFAVKGGL